MMHESLDQQAKTDSIHRIVARGLPPKPSFSRALSQLFHTVGYKNVFRGTGDAVAAALLVSAGALLAASLLTAHRPVEQALSLFPIFALAPLLYFSLLAFTSWKERMAGTWQVITACRYNLKYLVAMRVILVSAIALFLLPLCTMPLMREAVYWKLLVGAYGSLLLYGSLALLSLLLSESLAARMAVPMLWIAAWVALAISVEPLQQEHLLAQIPLEIYGLFAAAALLIYILELRILILRTRRITYAFH